MLELFDWQKEALMKMHDGCILHGGVGSGKSLVSLVYYCTTNGGVYSPKHPMRLEDPPDLYIITTAKKRDSCEWLKEMIPFGLVPIENDISNWGSKVIVDSWNNIKKYSKISRSFFIFDEQRVVGYGAWTKAFLEIAKNNRWILLSATPGDTWMDYVPVFVANGFYRNKSHFISEHVIYKPFRNFPQVDRYINTLRLERLRNNLLVDMNRPKEVITREETVILDYDKEKYFFVWKNRFDPFKQEPIRDASSLSYCLRRIANEDDSRKEKLLELLEKHPRIIVFYSFDYELDILLSLPYRYGVAIAQWNGHKHQEIPESDKWVYLCQYTAGCEGWNCIKTNTIVFYSQQHSYKVFEQAKGRIDRLNTPYTSLNYYYFRSRAQIDIMISRCLETKKNFNAGSAFSGMFKEGGFLNA